MAPVSSTDPNASGDAPTGSQLKYYQDYVKGARQVTYGDRAAGDSPGKLEQKLIQLFGVLGDPGKTNAKVSTRALGKIGETGLATTDLNWLTTGTAAYAGDFIPARATVSVRNDTVSAPVSSKLTGRKYKPKGANSYTFPFGKGTETTSDFKTEADKIKTKVATGTTARSVSFRSEDLIF